jgi:ABC-2 type transport system ATP-binding protein
VTDQPAPGIVVNDLVKRYSPDAPPAVDGLSFHVRPGEVYGLLGPNGSGKSTTIGVLATLLEPTAGRVAVAGFDVVSQPVEVRRRIGVALQETGVDLGASGRDLLIRHARLLGMGKPDAAARADQLLAEFDLVDAGAKRLKAYSGGSSTLPWRWSGGPRWCSSTSRRPVSTRSRAGPCGSAWSACARRA